MSNILNYLILIIPILVNIAFITLLERKILGYSQLRKGPNKVRIYGILQPFNDAIKLFSKELLFPSFSNAFQYILSPLIALFIVLLRYSLFPMFEIIFSFRFSLIFLYILLRINIYPLLVSGWASNRKYALIGALRAIAQTVSYEVSLATILIFYLGLALSLRLKERIAINEIWNKLIIFLPLIIILLISLLAETNRTPFDFAEGESELVSGFNIEYGSIGFALIFMAEYGRIIFLRIIFVSLFTSSKRIRILFWVGVRILISIWIWIRSTFPRYRYDKLINLTWKLYLPLSLFFIRYMLFIIIIF